MIQKLLSWISPKSFNDGTAKCNALGMSLVRKRRVENFLDLGCCQGDFTLEFAKSFKPKKIYAIEYADEYIKEARKRGILCMKQDLNEKWKFKSNYFDVILSSQNIEHMHNTRLYLEECYRCLKKGGQLIVLTENLASTINIFALLFGWQPFSTTNINGVSLGNPCIWHTGEVKNIKFNQKYHEESLSGVTGHVRVMTYQGLLEMMRFVGFDKVKICSAGYLPLWGRLSELMCRIDRRHGHFLIANGFKK